MKRQLLVCECEDVSYQLIFTQFEDDSDIYVNVHLNKLSFLKRLKIGFRYIFGHQSEFGAFEEIILNKEKLTKIIEKCV